MSFVLLRDPVHLDAVFIGVAWLQPPLAGALSGSGAAGDNRPAPDRRSVKEDRPGQGGSLMSLPLFAHGGIQFHNTVRYLTTPPATTTCDPVVVWTQRTVTVLNKARARETRIITSSEAGPSVTDY